MARSPDDESDRARKKRDTSIPDFPGAASGLKGVKSPFSPRQEGDIRDRLQAAGVLRAELNKG